MDEKLLDGIESLFENHRDGTHTCWIDKESHAGWVLDKTALMGMIRLARLGLWAVEDGIPILKEMGCSACGAGMYAKVALAALPKDPT